MERNHQSLYRVYRPTNFDDVAGHKNIVEILKAQLKTQTFGHAFLFSGQRGTGKTSVARILAKAVNCLNLQDGNPCNECANCLAFNANNFSDVYEIDAASNNGVDEIRNIKANIATLPIIGKYKVYIIDEVHMLTKGAFNALLKTLEEPPTHAIFILATTEYDKIPSTITSRCQSFNFKKINQTDLISRLDFISQKEGYSLDKGVGQAIYDLSEGSLRDALNVLEQLMILSDDNQLTMTNLKKVFYVTTKLEKLEILTEIFNQNVASTIAYFEKAKNQGMDFEVFSLSLLKLLKEIIEFNLTKNETLLNELELDEVKAFDEIELSDLFLLVDYLTSAYSQTKTRSLSYEAIVLNIIRSMQNFSQKYSLEITFSNDEETDTIIEEVVQPQKIDFFQEQEIPEPMDDFEPSLEEPTLIDNFISAKKPKPKSSNNEEVPSNLLGLINKQNELILEEEQFDQPIQFLTEALINVLRGAVVDKTFMLRQELNNQLTKFFATNDQSDLLTPIQANQLLPLYNAKVVVANNNELIMTVDDDLTANLINHWLVNETNREALSKVLNHSFVVYVVSEQVWSEVKITHVKLKEKGILPTYQPVDLKMFYQNNAQKIQLTTSSEHQELIDKVSNLFAGEDIKIG